jgi:ATP-dependent Lhr-like helicase
MRECLQDVFDVPGLTSLMRDLESRTIRLVEVETQQPSPFARSLLFGYVAQFLYEGDSPLAERRAAALALDTGLLAELLGQAELRELLDDSALAQVEADLQRLSEGRRARDGEDAADLLRLLGPLSTPEAVARGVDPAWLVELEGARRVIRVRLAGEERWASIEDAGRLRDALGLPLPVGIPEAFLEPVADPVGDLVARYARTHGPFTTAEVADRFGLGRAVVLGALQRLASSGRLVEGELRPGGSGTEWCDAEVLRLLRRRSMAALRHEAEPVPPIALARFLPAWQQVGSPLRGVDGLMRVVEQLQGAPVPASALERLVLPARVRDYTPALLDELTAAGEVLWCGHGALPGDDGWLSLHLPDSAPTTLPLLDPEAPTTPLHAAVIEALDGEAALFFRALSDRVGSLDDNELLAVLWDLVWSGRLTNDTLGPVRTLVGGGRPAHPVRRTPRARYGRPGRAAMPVRTGPPSASGRWSLLPARDEDPTRRGHALAETLLDRHGVVTRGAVVAERAPGGFAAVYRVLSAFEEVGRTRRGYAVEGLGAAQFFVPGAVDRLRTYAPDPGRPREAVAAVVLAATDPANAYGSALPWPERPGEVASGHKPGRKAGALVVLHDGALVVYVERGGRSLLTWTEDPEVLQPAVDALALAVREGQLGKLAVERADGAGVLSGDTALARALERAGFHATPRGLRLRA